MILPRRGRIAWISRIRPPSALTAGRITFDQVEFALVDIATGAVAKFAGKAAAGEAPLRSRISSFCLRAATRASAASRPLLPIAFAAFGFSSRNLVRYSPKRLVDDAFDFAVAELGFGLAFELRMRHAAADDGGEAFAEIFAGGDEVFEEAAIFAVLVDAAGERGAEAGKMRAAFGRVDVVDVRVNVFGVLAASTAGRFRP